MVKRKYDATSRQRGARRTRQAILDAAAELFVAPGYAASRLADIADHAGVALPTVYSHFGSKAGLLSTLVDMTIAGDDEPVPIAQRSFVTDIEALAGAREKLVRYAAHLASVQQRLVDVQLALQAAATADPDAALILRKNVEERQISMRSFARSLIATGQVRADLTPEQVADVLWLAMDVANYDWLVRRRGWSSAAYQQWYVSTVSGAVLADPPDGDR